MKKITSIIVVRSMGLLVLLLGGSLVGCNNTNVTYIPQPLPTPHPTACPAWGCLGPPIRPVFPIVVSTGSSGGSSSGSSGSTGSAGGSSGSSGSAGGSSGSTGTSAGGSSGSTDSVDGGTKDVDLQRAGVQQDDLNTRAASVAAQFQMSFTSAVQLTQLSDQISELTNSGQQMTDDDRAAVTTAALEIAGITSDDVNTATAQSLSGNTAAVNDLLTKAALNMGMTSATMLRDQLLPAVGVNLN